MAPPQNFVLAPPLLIIRRYEDSMLLSVEDRFIEEILLLDHFLIWYLNLF
jgi:hypothetical protein